MAPSAGAIVFDGEDITALAGACAASRRGIAYTFQITSVFGNLSVFDNVALAAQSAHAAGADAMAPDRHRRARACASTEALERVGLADRRDAQASELAYGHQRLLEVAMGLALAPKLLILDEPTQGLSDAEIASFCELVRAIAREATVLLIEHNMEVVMELADTHHRDEPRTHPGGRHARGDQRRTRPCSGPIWAPDAGAPRHRLLLRQRAGAARRVARRSQAGEVLCLLGRNGAGKTTALKAIMGLVPAARRQHRCSTASTSPRCPPTRCRSRASPTCRRAAGSSPS